MMSRLLLLLFFVLHTAQAGQLPKALALQAKQHSLDLNHLGLYVHVIGEKNARVAFNSQQAMNPASTMKLVTTAAALHVLGPAYTWRTEAYAHGAMQNATLQGDLILKGSGDPKLTLEEFWLLLRQVRARGVQHIQGDLRLDRSLYQPISGAPGNFDGDGLRPYNAMPDALLVNFNAVKLDFIPSGDGSTGVQILMHPSLPQVQIVNRLQVVDGPCNEWAQDPTHDVATATLTFTGRFPRSCGETTRNYSPLTSLSYVEALFRALWNELGGTLHGKAMEGPTPSTARLIAAQESEPLTEVIRDINKFSNNVMARQLFLSMGASPPLNTAKGVQAVNTWLEKNNLHWPELVMENGSGLSRVERISPRHLGELLITAARSPFAPEYIASLPLSAVDGTMRKRLSDTAVAGRAHIKTGYLDGVRASAGYVLDVNGRMVVLVCLVNGPSANASKPFHDALIEWAHGLATKQNCCGK